MTIVVCFGSAAYYYNIQLIFNFQPITRSQPGNCNSLIIFSTSSLYFSQEEEKKLILDKISLRLTWLYSLNLGKITFSWKSLATAYAIFFYTVMTVIVIIVGRERIHILQTTKKFDDKIYAILFVIFLVPHFWIPFVGWGKCSLRSLN